VKMEKGQVVATPPLPSVAESISVFRRAWPVAGLAAAVIVNFAWMSFLGYGFFTLVKPALFD
jgi:hypothetical protein